MEQGMGCFESFVRWERSICTEETKRGMGGDGSFVRYFRSGGWDVTNRFYEGNGARDGRCRGRKWEGAERLYGTFGAEGGRWRIVCTKETERGMGGNESFVRRKRSGGWEGAELLFSAVKEKSIDFFRIHPYNGSDGMEAAIRLYGCNTRGPSYKRFVFYHLPRRIHVSSAPTSSVLYFKNYRSTAMLLLFPALLRSDPCSDLSYSLGGYYGARRFESTENRLERRGDVFLQHAIKVV